MFIENPEILRTWLTSALEPICDADPAALAKYVMALLKKDRPEADLRDFCVDQLDVFLQKETRSFVDLLFTVVRDRSYLTGGSRSAAKASPTTPTSSALSTTTAVPTVHPPPPVAVKEVESRPPQKGPVKLRISPLSEKPVRSHRSRSRSKSRDKQNKRHDSRSSRRSTRSGRKRSRSRSADRKKPQTTSGRGHRANSPTLPDGVIETLPADSSSQRFGPTSSGSSPPAIPIGSGPEKSPPTSGVNGDKDTLLKTRKRPRCRDYDEKGYCMRGDLCAFDHGPDPVVVENEILPEMLKIGGPVVHPSLRAPPPNLAVPPPGYTNRHPPPPGVDSFSEPYNPEAPSLTSSGAAPIIGTLPPPPAVAFAHPPPPLWAQPPPGMVPGGYGVSSTTGPIPPPGAPLPVPNVSSVVTRIGGRNRELITVTDQLEEGPPDVKRRKFPFDDGASGPGQYRKQSIFDRIGDRSYPVQQKTNKPAMNSSTLEVRKIPVHLNNITKLNEHFSQFGNIKNIQVQYDGDMEAALITYSQRYEAIKAHKSTMPILNNRFIRVFWHNAPEEEGGANRDDSNKTQIKNRLGDPRSASHFNNLQNNVTGANSDDVADARRAVIITNKVGGQVSRTIFNKKSAEGAAGAKSDQASDVEAANDGDENVTPAAETSAAKSSGPPPRTSGHPSYYSEEAQKQRKEKVKEAWKSRMELYKRKTELFEKQVEQQKVILKQLEKCKDASQKKELFSFLKTLQTSTSKLKEEIRTLKLPTSRTKEQVQKEVLDTELEMINQKQAGQDINVLQKKLTDLKSEITKLCSTTPAAAKASQPPTSAVALKEEKESVSQESKKEPIAVATVTIATGDKKPRDLNITGFPVLSKTRLMSQLKLAGEIEKLEEKSDPTPCVYVLYKERSDAEAALSSIAKSGEFGPINIKWGTTVESGMKEEDSGLSARAILASLGDDGLSDEEDDDEALRDEDEVLKEEEEEEKGWKR